MFVSAFAPSPAETADDRWIEAYQAVEFRNPDTYSVNGYVAMQVLAAGARDADTFDSGDVADALRGNQVQTLLGELTFEEDGDLTDPQIWIYRVLNGEFSQVQ
jgi:branched-chain amino acid transport system substrate-binding protein